MKSLWRSLCIALALSCVVTIMISAGCGPAKAFCPNTSPNKNGVCPILGDDGGGIQQDSQGSGLTCDAGFQPGFAPGSNTLSCVPR
jgi:hypothetical protein